MSSASRWSQRRRQRRRCRGIFISSAPASISGIAPPSLATTALLLVGVDVYPPPPPSPSPPQMKEPQRVYSVPSLPSEDLISCRLRSCIGRLCRKRQGFGLLIPFFLRRIRSRRWRWLRRRPRNGEIGKSAKLEQSITKIPYDKLVFQLL